MRMLKFCNIIKRQGVYRMNRGGGDMYVNVIAIVGSSTNRECSYKNLGWL